MYQYQLRMFTTYNMTDIIFQNVMLHIRFDYCFYLKTKQKVDVLVSYEIIF